MDRVKLTFRAIRLSVLLVLMSFASCISIVGLTDDYKKTTENQKALILPFSQTAELKNGNVYIINAGQLKAELSKYEKSIVYCFTNGCSNEFCYPMRTYIDYAEANGYKLFLVMNGFGDMQHTLSQSAPTPYYVIDSKAYDSKYRAKYTRLFENELLGRAINYKEKDYQGNLFFFKGSTHVETKKNLEK